MSESYEVVGSAAKRATSVLFISRSSTSCRNLHDICDQVPIVTPIIDSDNLKERTG